MKKTTAAILIGAAVLGAGFIWHMTHGISLFAHTDYGDKDANSHTEDEIRMAFSMARKAFRRFDGCVMTDLRYSEELTQQEQAQYDHDFTLYVGDPDKWVDDVIVLESDFTTSKMSSEPELAGCTQHGWNWIITHTPEGGWELKDGFWGYA